MLNSRTGLMSIREINPLNAPTDSSLSVELLSQDSPSDCQLEAVNPNDTHPQSKPVSTSGPSNELLSIIDRFCLENDCPLEVKRTWCSETSYKSDYPSDLVPAIKIKINVFNKREINYYLYSLSDSCKYGITMFYYEEELRSKTMFRKNVADGPSMIYKNEQIVQEQFFKKGLKFGPDTTYYENGQKETCYYYVNGMLNGRSSKWFPNGQLCKLYRYKNNDRNGLYQEWHPNGQLSRKSHYQHDKEHGLTEMWNVNGVRTSETQYQQGLRHGVYRFWFVNGQLMEETNYLHDRSHGVSRRWYSNGTLREVSNYLNGFRDGLQQTYDENGTLTSQNEVRYSFGRPQEQPILDPIFQDRHFLPLPRLEMCALCLEDDSRDPDNCEEVKEPKCNTFAVLRCGHTCCQSCIKGAFKTGRCWTCRKNITSQDVFLCRKWDDTTIKQPIKEFISDPDLLSQILS